MRAILATAIYCAVAFGCADAHARNYRRSLPAAAMLAPGLLHMLQSMDRPRARYAEARHGAITLRTGGRAR
jgi:hypothetical protein